MTRNDRICKMPPWTMAKISRDIYNALVAMGLGDSTVEKLHYQAMGSKLKDVESLINIKPYLG